MILPGENDPDDVLRRLDPGVYGEGITAMAAIPLLFGRESAPGPQSPAGGDRTLADQGVLYVSFRDGPAGVHRFTPEEIDWLEQFSASAAYAIRHVTAFELRRLCRINGLEVKELLGHPGLWCKGLYPKWFYVRGIARVVHAIYPTLVRLRPQFFARYLFVRAEKKVHVAARGAAPAEQHKQAKVA